jgi:hypothetical protein
MKKIIHWFKVLFSKTECWEYGRCRNRVARRHKIFGNVQFILWEAGKQGHESDFWINFDPTWWDLFKPNESVTVK